MSLIDEQAGFLKDLRKLLQFAEEKNWVVTGGELERAPELQAIYLREGREKTMDSPHLRKCAMTLNFFSVDDNGAYRLIQTAAELEAIGNFWEQLDPRNRWGGRRSVLDTLRFERDPGGWPSSADSTLIKSDLPSAAPDAVALAGDVRPTVMMLRSASNALAPTLKRGDLNRDAISRLQTLLKKTGSTNPINSIFDADTERAVIEFQSKNNLIADGVVGEKTWTTLLSQTSDAQEKMAQRFLGEADLQTAANNLGIELACLKSVYKVESNGKGFIGDEPKILFEGHVFWQRLKKLNLRPEKLADGNGDILYPSWTKQFYIGGAGEMQRLQRAQAINREAALESASWGLFQIMGYHWKTLGYNSVDEFIERMRTHERDQLDAFCRFITVNKDYKGRALIELLRAKEWSSFALAYNGAGYRKNSYDDKLRDQYLRFAA